MRFVVDCVCVLIYMLTQPKTEAEPGGDCPFSIPIPAPLPPHPGQHDLTLNRMFMSLC